MPRRNLIRTHLHPYHVTIRSNNREWFDLPLEEVWEICIDSLKLGHSKNPVQIQAFVLMANHYHLMLRTPNCDLDKFMFTLNSNISKLIRERTGRINRIFGDRYNRSVIQDIQYYNVCLRYVYQNPLVINLVQRCEDYPYSSLFYVYRGCDLGINWYEPTFGEGVSFLEWVNSRDPNGLDIAKAMKKPIFKLPKKRSSRRLKVKRQDILT